MIATSDLDTIRAFADDKRKTTNPDVIGALDRAVSFLDAMRDDSKRETATLAGIEDLLKTTEEAIADGPADPPDQASALATVGVMGAVAHVATNLAAIADSFAKIQQHLAPQLIVRTAEQAAADPPDVAVTLARIADALCPVLKDVAESGLVYALALAAERFRTMGGGS